jgi:phosphoribosylamine--glycine ligase
VIEYNCRMGDPETEVVLPRLETDLVGLFIAATQKELNTVKLRVDERSAVTVMAVSRGYPGSYEKGFEIKGLEQKKNKDSFIFHAGTAEAAGKVTTSGGRVLCVTSYGKNVREAAELSLLILEDLDFEGIYFRTDIGYEFKPTVSKDVS